MRTTRLAPMSAYRAVFGEDRRADWALVLVLLTLLGATLTLYDAYAKGRWGGRQRTLAIPVAMEPIAVTDADLGKVASAQSGQPATSALLAAVQRANVAFAEARARADAAPLLPVATGEWLAQEQAYIAGMRARGQTERWRLLGLEVVREEIRPDGTGFVCTTERWEVQTLGADGRVLSTRTYIFSEGYTLVRQDNDWKVSRVEVG
ncbi:MAG TPA: hypothetical protein VNL77_04215 [Roseiflexaceae bacterium]|nr:hypothetical protein [Roseiflexaceae bacterium]